MFFGKKGQGTIEYLVIIAIVVVISLVVVSLMLGFLDQGSSVSEKSSKLSNWSNIIALTETSVTHDGNYLVRLANNSGEELTVTNVQVGDSSGSYSQDLFMSGTQNFVVDSSEICDLGKSVSKTVTITYVSKYGLTKTERFPVDTFFNCEDYVVNVSLLANQCEVCPTLVWSNYNSTLSSWDTQVNNCATMNSPYGFGDSDYLGWRLPTVDELDAVKASYPDEDLWTSSTLPNYTTYAYRLHSGYGIDSPVKITSSGARCVRWE